MALHQPALAPHHVPRWAEAALVLAVVAGVVVLLGIMLVAGNVRLGSQTPASNAQELIVSGHNGGAIRYTGIPYPAAHPAWMIQGHDGGGIIYTGIPYPPPGN